MYPAILVVPVVGHCDEGAELSRFLDHGEEPVEGIVHVTGDDLLAHPVVEAAVGVGHGLVALHHSTPGSAAVEQVAYIVEARGEGVGPRDTLGLRGRVGEEYGAGDLEVGAVGNAPRLIGGRLVGLPDVGDDVRGDQAVGEGLESPLSRRPAVPEFMDVIGMEIGGCGC